MSQHWNLANLPLQKKKKKNGHISSVHPSKAMDRWFCNGYPSTDSHLFSDPNIPVPSFRSKPKTCLLRLAFPPSQSSLLADAYWVMQLISVLVLSLFGFQHIRGTSVLCYINASIIIKLSEKILR